MATAESSPGRARGPASAEGGRFPRLREEDRNGQARDGHDDPVFAAKRIALASASATLEQNYALTAAHSDDVVSLCEAIADRLGVNGSERKSILAAAALHDIGKVAIPQEVVDKPGPLEPGERDVVQRHTIAGERIISSVPDMDEVARLVRWSHERWDGAGYPDGLTGDDIPLGSRIIFCADAFNAIRCDRPYRRGQSADQALAEVRQNAGTQFDPADRRGARGGRPPPPVVQLGPRPRPRRRASLPPRRPAPASPRRDRERDGGGRPGTPRGSGRRRGRGPIAGLRP